MLPELVYTTKKCFSPLLFAKRTTHQSPRNNAITLETRTHQSPRNRDHHTRDTLTMPHISHPRLATIILPRSPSLPPTPPPSLRPLPVFPQISRTRPRKGRRNTKAVLVAQDQKLSAASLILRSCSCVMGFPLLSTTT